MRITDHIFRDAADQQPLEALALVRSRHDQVGVLAPGALENASCGRADDCRHPYVGGREPVLPDKVVQPFDRLAAFALDIVVDSALT